MTAWPFAHGNHYRTLNLSFKLDNIMKRYYNIITRYRIAIFYEPEVMV